MRRRAFITLIGGVAAWPLAVRAQQRERMRRIGALTGAQTGEENVRAQLAAFLRRLEELGWVEGRNVAIDLRGGRGDPDRLRTHAAELLAVAPDVILAALRDRAPRLELLRETLRTILRCSYPIQHLALGRVGAFRYARGRTLSSMDFHSLGYLRQEAMLSQVR